MNRWLLSVLRCPVCAGPFELTESRGDGDAVHEGGLACRSNHQFRITNGIPRFVTAVDDSGQAQTAGSFGFKWQQLWGHDGETQAFYRRWFLQRFGFVAMEALGEFLGAKLRMLDAGTGNGQSAGWYSALLGGQWVGVDISLSVDVAQRQLGPAPSRDLVQADILNLPFADGNFDVILSDGVLHHTPSTRDALGSVTRLLQPGGEILFYVYRKKGPIREFCDDHIRDVVSPLPPEEAWEALKPLTRLGEALARAGVTIEVPEDIPYLGMTAGKDDLQRFVYENMFKLFWNDAFSFDENHHINFDWYHPRYAHRQTEAEVALWCEELGLSITHRSVEHSGISVRATKL